ncbi:MAG: tryptophan synthase subunit alpha [Nitrospinae bacterium]|nr:tryptophan synthase subunit alpha [Nitrospinota bacterium]
MSRIESTFAKLKAEKRRALVIFLTAGDPDIETTVRLVLAAKKAGADIVELGVPFSDPLADGPVIQESFHRAIKRGASLTKVLAAVKKIREQTDVPLVFMLASTLIINHGVNKFMRQCAEAGVDGIIIPDAPLEEIDEFAPSAKDHGLDIIMLAAPTSPSQRLKQIAARSSGFVYYISVAGVTGNKLASATEAGKGIKALKKTTRLPVCAGFGVTGPEQARQMSAVADGVIIGSQAVRVINSAGSPEQAVRELSKFVSSVRRAMDKK